MKPRLRARRHRIRRIKAKFSPWLEYRLPMLLVGSVILFVICPVLLFYVGYGIAVSDVDPVRGRIALVVVGIPGGGLFLSALLIGRPRFKKLAYIVSVFFSSFVAIGVLRLITPHFMSTVWVSSGLLVLALLSLWSAFNLIRRRQQLIPRR